MGARITRSCAWKETAARSGRLRAGSDLEVGTGEDS